MPIRSRTRSAQGSSRRHGRPFALHAARTVASPALASLALASLALASLAGAAPISKCVDRSGSVTYSDLGCTAAGEPVHAELPPLGIVPPLAQPVPPGAAAKRPPAERASRERPTATARERAATATRERPAAAPPGRSPPAAPGRTDASHRRFVSLGMSDAEVLARVGRPDRIVRAAAGSRSGGTRTLAARERWIYLPTPGDSDTITVVEVEGGVVANVDRRLVR